MSAGSDNGRVDRPAVEVKRESLAVPSQPPTRYCVKPIDLKRKFKAAVGGVIAVLAPWSPYGSTPITEARSETLASSLHAVCRNPPSALIWKIRNDLRQYGAIWLSSTGAWRRAEHAKLVAIRMRAWA